MTRLVVVSGVPGVGKTTVSEEIARRLPAELLRTDVVRKEIIPESEYTKAEERTVYGELFDRARSTLAEGTTVVLDGTFHDRSYRERAAAIASDAADELVFVAVECDETVVRERIAARTDDESDADYEVYQHFCAIYDPLEREHVTIDNSGSLEETYAQVADAVAQTAGVVVDDGG